jgi:biopolymer transport protein ExbD
MNTSYHHLDMNPVDDDGNESFGVVASDIILNLMFIVLLASASLVAAGQVDWEGLPINPATGSSGEKLPALPSPPLVVTISAAGEMSFEGARLGDGPEAAELLAAKLRQSLSDRSGTHARVLVVPDAAAPWQAVAAVDLAVAKVTSHYFTVITTSKQEQRP